jgi:hypothetical protein
MTACRSSRPGLSPPLGWATPSRVYAGTQRPSSKRLCPLSAPCLRDSGEPAPWFSEAADRPAGCYVCRYFGERRDPAVWCAKPGGEHVRSQAKRGSAFWEREPGANDELPVVSMQGRAATPGKSP